METTEHRERPAGRRRTANACHRCRQHKIKCSGNQPCTTCSRRQLDCVFGTRQTFSQAYVRDLERRVAASERRHLSASTVTTVPDDFTGTGAANQIAIEDAGFNSIIPHQRGAESQSGITTPSAERTSSNEPLINSLASGRPFYLQDVQGNAIYLGTSSNWSFSRRVLKLAQESIMKIPLTPNSLLWEGKAYDLGWDGNRAPNSLPNLDEKVVIPQADFGIYLVNSVKFYVGQIFHLFDEEEFMQKLNRFYSGSDTEALTSSVWYNHFLLLLAFGKAFVARGSPKDEHPPGGEFFLQAITTLPDMVFANADPIESVEVYCCAALYLHCIDMRCAAYKMIGHAVRTSLERGMHTTMQHLLIPEDTLERSRRVWWTTVILDRHISALCGLPLAIRDDEISAPLPLFGGMKMRAMALSIHARLSKVMAKIVNSIYGREGRQSSTFLVHTKTALEEISMMTDELNASFRLSLNESMPGISRVAAYLHILQHQCIILATRPILFNFLEARLARPEQPARNKRPSDNIWALLQICRDSALHIIRILCALQSQGLLENFLSFDLDATSASITVLQMAAHIDPPLLENHRQWSQMAAGLMGEMSSRGNRIATNLKQEVERLDKILENLPARSIQTRRRRTRPEALQIGSENVPTLSSADSSSTPLTAEELTADWLNDAPMLNDELNAEQMKLVAEAIDLDGLEWWFNKEYDPILQI